MMKYLIAILILFCFNVSIFSEPLQIQTGKKDFLIHKSKRVFVEKQSRPYIKKKIIQQSEKSQKSVSDFIESGNQKEEKSDYKGALADFNKALLIEPNNTKALYYSGFMKFQMDDFGNALTDYTQAIESDTASVELFYSRGNAYFELRYYKEAIADYGKALALDSTDKLSYFNRGIAKYYVDEIASSCKDLRWALEYGDIEAEAVIKEVCH